MKSLLNVFILPNKYLDQAHFPSPNSHMTLGSVCNTTFVTSLEIITFLELIQDQASTAQQGGCYKIPGTWEHLLVKIAVK